MVVDMWKSLSVVYKQKIKLNKLFFMRKLQNYEMAANNSISRR